jgi:predicted nucleic acid-binding protein
VDHVLKEVANAIWKRAALHRRETLETAWARLRVLLKLVESEVIILENEQDYIVDAFKIALETGITVYDALYVAQAVRLGAVLVTSDEKQAKTAEKLNVRVIFLP